MDHQYVEIGRLAIFTGQGGAQIMGDGRRIAGVPVRDGGIARTSPADRDRVSLDGTLDAQFVGPLWMPSI